MRLIAGADWAFMRDSAALVFVRQIEYAPEKFYYAVEFERVWLPGSTPLRPSIVFREAMLEIDDREAESFCCDDHYLASTLEVSETYDIEHIRFPSDNEGIAEAFVNVRVMLGGGRIDLTEASPELIEELKLVGSIPLAGGLLRINHPRRGHSHGDRARAMVSAIYALELASNALVGDDVELTGGPRRMARKGRHGAKDSAGKWRDLPPKRREFVHD